MQNVTDRISNPFDMDPPCESFVPGYGDANADFHVVGDHPGVHGGAETGVPFTNDAGQRLQQALLEAELLTAVGDAPEPVATFLSYLYMCVPDGEPSESEEAEPTERDYAELEPFFDAELRAIAAHVLLPVGERATRHVLRNYTAKPPAFEVDMDQLHGTELLGSGWLVVPIKEPAAWDDGDADRLTEALLTLRSTDYRRESDLGRFLPGSDTYLVR